jgi:trans-aconitate methyltransferase
MRRLKNVARSWASQLGVISSAPSPPEQAPAWYDAAYTAVDEYRQHYSRSRYYFLWTVIADRVRRAEFRQVLEIGCGPGQLASFLFDQGIQAYAGLDFSPVAIDIARSTVPTARFVLDDARTSHIYTEFPHEVIICTEVLEHIQDDLRVISRFPVGSHCICTVPNFPYDSHVRHFPTAAAVTARYAAFFGDFDVAEFRGVRSEKETYFIFEGVRNEHCG